MKYWRQIIGILGVIIGLAIVLVPFSLIIGWNIASVIGFWFLIVPSLSYLIPFAIPKNHRHLIESLIGIILFYGVMIFLIYKHSETDFFLLMIISGVSSIILLFGIHSIRIKKGYYDAKNSHTERTE